MEGLAGGSVSDRASIELCHGAALILRFGLKLEYAVVIGDAQGAQGARALLDRAPERGIGDIFGGGSLTRGIVNQHRLLLRVLDALNQPQDKIVVFVCGQLRLELHT